MERKHQHCPQTIQTCPIFLQHFFFYILINAALIETYLDGFGFFSQSVSKSSQILCFLNNLRITLPSRLYLYLSLLRINEWGFSKKGGNLCLLVGDIKYHEAFWHGFKEKKKKRKKNEKKKKSRANPHQLLNSQNRIKREDQQAKRQFYSSSTPIMLFSCPVNLCLVAIRVLAFSYTIYRHCRCC